MNNCAQALQDFDDAIEQALAQLQAAAEPALSEIDQTFRNVVGGSIDGLRQSILNVQADYVAVMTVGAAG